MNTLEDLNKKMVEEWQQTLSDDLLEKCVDRAVSGSGWTAAGARQNFAIKIYPLIQDQELKQRVDNILIKLSKENMDAVYVCAKHNLPGIREVILKLIEKHSQPITWDNYFSFGWLNESIKECPMKEAEFFLVNQLEWVKKIWSELTKIFNNPPIDIADFQEWQKYYCIYSSAIAALEAINPKLASDYAKQLVMPKM